MATGAFFSKMRLENKMHWGVLRTCDTCLIDGFIVPYMSLWENSSLWNDQVDFILSLGFSGVLFSGFDAESHLALQVNPSSDIEKKQFFISIISEAIASAKQKGLQVALSVAMQNPSLFFAKQDLTSSLFSFVEVIHWKSLVFQKISFSKEDCFELTAQERLEKEVNRLCALFPSKKLLLDLSFFPKKTLPWLYKAVELFPFQICPIFCPFGEAKGVHPYLQQKPFEQISATNLLFTMDPKGVFPPLFHLIFLGKMETIFSVSGALPNASFLLPIPQKTSTLSSAIICGMNHFDAKKESMRFFVAFSLKKAGVSLADLELFPGYSLLTSAAALYQLLGSSFFKRYEEKKEQFILCHKLLDSSQSFWEKEGVFEWIESIEDVKKRLEALAKRESVTLNPASANQNIFSFS